MLLIGVSGMLHSLKHICGEKFLNMMNNKIEHDEGFAKRTLIISLLCLIETEKDVSDSILDRQQ